MYLHVSACMCLYASHSREVKAGIPCSSGAGRRGFDPHGVRCFPLSHSGQTAADSSRGPFPEACTATRTVHASGPQHHFPKHARPQGPRTRAINWACAIVRARQAQAAPCSTSTLGPWSSTLGPCMWSTYISVGMSAVGMNRMIRFCMYQ
jgi:hypothetical protein